MNQLNTGEDIIYEAYKETGLETLFSGEYFKNREEIVYRKNGKSVDKIIEFDAKTGTKVKTTYYDYFADNKVRSVDEYDITTGKKVRTTNFVLYKSIDEYDLETGKKFRTINFNVKDETKISSIQEYDLKTGKIIKISIYKKDGITVGTVKEINPISGEVNDSTDKECPRKSFQRELTQTVSYDNITSSRKPKFETISNLIDKLYGDKKNLVDTKKVFNL